MSFDIRDDGFDPSADPWWDPATRDWAMWYQIEIYASEDLYDRRDWSFENWQLRWNEDMEKIIEEPRSKLRGIILWKIAAIAASYKF